MNEIETIRRKLAGGAEVDGPEWQEFFQYLFDHPHKKLTSGQIHETIWYWRRLPEVLAAIWPDPGERGIRLELQAHKATTVLQREASRYGFDPAPLERSTKLCREVVMNILVQEPSWLVEDQRLWPDSFTWLSEEEDGLTDFHRRSVRDAEDVLLRLTRRAEVAEADGKDLRWPPEGYASVNRLVDLFHILDYRRRAFRQGLNDSHRRGEVDKRTSPSGRVAYRLEDVAAIAHKWQD